jgi:hypothetical protein
METRSLGSHTSSYQRSEEASRKLPYATRASSHTLSQTRLATMTSTAAATPAAYTTRERCDGVR